MRLSIKSETKTGKLAISATEKQIKYANDIIDRINGALDEISAMGYPIYANMVGAELDSMTNIVESGARDIIEYLKNVDRKSVFSRAYSIARVEHDSKAVKDLNPMKL